MRGHWAVPVIVSVLLIGGTFGNAWALVIDDYDQAGNECLLSVPSVCQILFSFLLSMLIP